MDIRKVFFSNRSYTPIPIALAMIYYSSFTIPYFFLGIFLILLGEITRISAVRYAGGATRTLKVGAPSLCTSGPYAFSRNPLYLGNMTIYLGFTLFAGGPLMWEILILVFIYFTIQYSMIISLEEEILNKKFNKSYLIYKKNVPRLFPRLYSWKNNDSRYPSEYKKTLNTEKRSLQNIILITLIILVKNYYRYAN